MARRPTDVILCANPGTGAFLILISMLRIGYLRASMWITLTVTIFMFQSVLYKDHNTKYYGDCADA